MSELTQGPLLWFLNRGTGVGLMVLLTVSTMLGVLSARPGPRRLVPAMIVQGLHRNLSVLSLVLLVAHVGTAVLDTFVDIRWWQAVSPVGATYRPFWLGLGSVAFDVMVLLVLTSLLRERIPHRFWRTTHWLAYLAWATAMAHGAGIGTDASLGWARVTWLSCLGVVAAAVLVRWFSSLRATRSAPSAPVAAPVALS